jgi:Mlc titration factor MtfA (ptsG expression regulator)
MSIIGEATPNEGPLSVSWDAALADSRNPANGRSVVIHEFAHKIDMSDGYTDGTPPLRGDSLERWTAVLADEYEHARTRPSDAALRPYAWTNRAEFFAVATEAFFCSAPALRDAKPALYEALAGFFGQDPAVRAVPPGS